MVMYAGFTPVFADVELDGLTLDVDAFQKAIGSQTKAVIAVHTFGHAANLADLAAVASTRGIVVIEDAAQSLGGMYEGRPMGAHGHLSVLSFGGEKILDAGGGGALLTDDSAFATIIEQEVKALPPFKSGGDALLTLSHRNLYHAMVDLLRRDQGVCVGATFRNAIPFYEDLYVRQFPANAAIQNRIVDGFAALADSVRARFGRGRRYAEQLGECDHLTIPSRWDVSGVLWRFSFLINDAAKTREITTSLRRSGIHASNHYWSLADLIYDDKSQPHSAYACPRIVNLWVDDTATEGYIDKSCDIVVRGLR